MMDDWELLARFGVDRSEQAFTELVRRHAGFVLATCRRRLRDVHLSEDVAQAVFLVLARRPPVRSAANASLAGWLHQSAIYACNNAIRATRARQSRERWAAEHVMNGRSLDGSMRCDARPVDRCSDAEVALEQAMSQLSRGERDAILLRYYEDQSVQQIGAALGISANSATKRITRALERLRALVVTKGFVIPAPAVVDAVSRVGERTASNDFVERTASMAVGRLASTAVVEQLAEGVK